jgi:transcriptional regulator with XRE-family HTH domain
MPEKPMTGKELREWRERLGHTQQRAAEWLGVSRVTVQNWEGGSTPIPLAIRAQCDELARRWKQRQPAYGPVSLLYADGPMAQPAWGTGRIAQLKHEVYPTNEDAVRRACELNGSPTFVNPLIVEADGGLIWNGVELRAECDRRSGVADRPRRR